MSLHVLFLSLLQATSKFVLGIKFGALKGEISEESDIFIKSVHNLSEYSAKVAQEPPILRRFVETKTWKAALKAQDAMLQMGTKVSSKFYCCMVKGRIKGKNCAFLLTLHTFVTASVQYQLSAHR